MSEAGKKILIIKPSALGDIVLALPALAALRKSFGSAHISWLVRPEFAELLRGHPDLDEVILFDRKLLGKWWCSRGAFANLWGLLRQLREARFDLVIDFQGLFRTGFFARATGCGDRIGPANAREMAGIFYTRKVEQDYARIHLVDYYLKMAEAAGAGKVKAEFKFPENAEAEKAVKRALSENGVNLTNYVVLVPSAARAEKLWPIDRFAELADKIAAKYGSSIVAIGTRGEGGYIETLVKKTKKRVINLAGRTTISELISLLKGARLVVSNDTGPGHIAAGLGVPMVMIFGPVNPSRLRPYGRPECFAGVEPNTMGMAIESRDRRYDISNVTMEQVWERVCGQLKMMG